jgi:hypothetical protein
VKAGQHHSLWYKGLMTGVPSLAMAVRSETNMAWTNGRAMRMGRGSARSTATPAKELGRDGARCCGYVGGS